MPEQRDNDKDRLIQIEAVLEHLERVRNEAKSGPPVDAPQRAVESEGAVQDTTAATRQGDEGSKKEKGPGRE